ncbi:MAG: penicillin-binding protein 2 [Patescibacteria group bacterium]
MNKNPFNLDFDSDKRREIKPLEWEESAVDSLSSVEGFAHDNFIFTAKRLQWILFAVFFIILAKVFYLQVVEGEYYSLFAENNRLRRQVVLAPRGIIKDRAGQVLARNTASFNLIATPFDLKGVDLSRQLQELSEIIDFDASAAEKKIFASSPNSLDMIVIRQDVPLEQSILFETRAPDFLGFSVQKVPVREYLNAESLFHVLGYAALVSEEEFASLNKNFYSAVDFIGKSGIEQMYENYLRGQNGSSQIEVDARGVLVSKLGNQEPQSGNSLILNIDKDLQDFLYRQLKGNGLSKRRSAAVAMNPKTGEVLAFISLPGVDGGKFMRGFTNQEYQKILEDTSLPLFNRVISGTYPPGSTVKPMVALAALEEKVIDEKTEYHDKGVLVISHQFDPSINYNFYGWKRDGLGKVDVKQAIAKSSDIFFYIVSGGYPKQDLPGLGIDRLAAYYRKFNLGKLTGIDLPSEAPGLVPDPEWKKQFYKDDKILSRWYLGDTYHVGIGQGDVLVTPLQVAVWTAAIANRGIAMQPQVMKKVLKGDDANSVLFEQKPQILFDRFVDLRHIKLVQDGMRETVVSGSGRALNTLSITSAGKTGTSQFDGSDPKRTHAWFTAYAPYEDPLIVISVLVEAGGEGSAVSVPVVKEVLRWWSENRYNK